MYHAVVKMCSFTSINVSGTILKGDRWFCPMSFIHSSPPFFSFSYYQGLQSMCHFKMSNLLKSLFSWWIKQSCGPCHGCPTCPCTSDSHVLCSPLSFCVVPSILSILFTNFSFRLLANILLFIHLYHFNVSKGQFFHFILHVISPKVWCQMCRTTVSSDIRRILPRWQTVNYACYIRQWDQLSYGRFKIKAVFNIIILWVTKRISGKRKWE